MQQSPGDKMSENCPQFVWTEQNTAVAIALAQGKTQQEVAAEVGISDRTIRRWLADAEFAAEVDRLSLMVDVASRAERLRLTMRVIRGKVKDGIPQTDKDLLEWLKFAQSETDGVKLDLGKIAAAFGTDDAPLAAGRSVGASSEAESETVN